MENYSGQFESKFIDRVCSLRGMNKEESKVKVGIEVGLRCEKDAASSTVDTLKSPGDCVSSKDQRGCGLDIHRRFGDA